MLALHGGVMVMALLWLAKQHNNWTLRVLLRRASRPPAPGQEAR
jgi:lipopolysaccharide export system permease protein